MPGFGIPIGDVRHDGKERSDGCIAPHVELRMIAANERAVERAGDRIEPVTQVGPPIALLGVMVPCRARVYRRLRTSSAARGKQYICSVEANTGAVNFVVVKQQLSERCEDVLGRVSEDGCQRRGVDLRCVAALFAQWGKDGKDGTSITRIIHKL